MSSKEPDTGIDRPLGPTFLELVVLFVAWILAPFVRAYDRIKSRWSA